MPPQSAGLLMFRRVPRLEVLLVHPGGPFWTNKDKGAWQLPKGGIEPDEEPLAAAIREFGEETGFSPCPPYLLLGSVKQKAGKRVTAWAFEGDCDPALLRSTTTRIEYPARSGRFIDAPEIDRAAWFTLDRAKEMILESQRPLLESLERRLADETPG